jgi:hypothetical protein
LPPLSGPPFFLSSDGYVWRLRQEAIDFEANLGYIPNLVPKRSYVRQKQNKQKKKKSDGLAFKLGNCYWVMLKPGVPWTSYA